MQRITPHNRLIPFDFDANKYSLNYIHNIGSLIINSPDTIERKKNEDDLERGCQKKKKQSSEKTNHRKMEIGWIRSRVLTLDSIS